VLNIIKVKCLKNEYNFDNISDAVNYIDKCDIHPDLLFIYIDGEIVSYIDLLLKSGEKLVSDQLIIDDIGSILENIKQYIINTKYNKILFRENIYRYGSVEHNYILKTGFNPIVKLSIGFNSDNSSYLNSFNFSTKKIRRIAEKYLENNWRLVRVQKEKLTDFDVGSKWLVFTIFLYKHRSTFNI